MAGADGTVTLFVVCGVRLHAEGLARLVAGAGHFVVLGSAPDPGVALDALARLAAPPAVVLVDAAVTGDLPGVRRLVARGRGAKVLALGVCEHDEDVVRWAEAGVAALLTRDAGAAELTRAIEGVLRGEAPMAPRVAAAVLRRVAALSAAATAHVARPGPAAPLPALTPREAEIARLLELGLSNKQIAARLAIGLPTVKNHVHHVLDKLGASSRGEAVALLRPVEDRSSTL